MIVRLRYACGCTEPLDAEPERDRRGWFAPRMCPAKCRNRKQRVVEFYSRKEPK